MSRVALLSALFLAASASHTHHDGFRLANCPWRNCSDHVKKRPGPYEKPQNGTCCVKTRDGVVCWVCRMGVEGPKGPLR